MKTSKIVSLTVIALFLGLATLPGLGQIQPPGQLPAAQQPEEASFDGILRTVDAEEQTLMVADEEEVQMTFRYNAETEVLGSEGTVQGLSAETGTPVRIAYLPVAEGQTPLASAILILDDEVN